MVLETGTEVTVVKEELEDDINKVDVAVEKETEEDEDNVLV